MRQGHSPQDACKKAVERLVKKNPDYKNAQVGFLAINKKGVHGAYALQKGFNYAIADNSGNKLIDAASYLK